MVDYGLNDRVVIITGTNNPQGIGAATALSFAREGAKVVLVYKRITRTFDESKSGENGVDRYYKANAGNTLAVETKLRQLNAQYLVLEKDISDVSSEQIKDLLLVLAKTEHLRWNASHEMLGYEYNKGKTIDLKYKHYCLCKWQKLDSDEIRSYDNNVVDVTLGTDIDKKEKETND